MRITIDKTTVEFIPESPAETAALESLWIRMGNCEGDNKALEPIGVYIPSEKNVAQFYIKGLSEEEASKTPTKLAPYDTDVYCQICNKTVHVKKGEQIPVCCGRLMEILD